MCGTRKRETVRETIRKQRRLEMRGRKAVVGQNAFTTPDGEMIFESVMIAARIHGKKVIELAVTSILENIFSGLVT